MNKNPTNLIETKETETCAASVLKDLKAADQPLSFPEKQSGQELESLETGSDPVDK